MEFRDDLNMQLCGTPLAIRRGLESSLLLDTYWHMSVNYADINLTAVVEKLNILESTALNVEPYQRPGVKECFPPIV